MTVTKEYYTKGTIEYTTGKYSGNFEYGSVSGLNNLKKYDSIAKLNVGKDTATKNRPAALTLRQFGISLPTGAEITNVIVEYAHRKVKGSNQKKAPNVLAPTIALRGFGSGKNPSTTGIAPTTSMKNRSVTFNFKPTKSQVESSNFGVHISYPKNKNDASGYIELKYIRIKINYVAPKFQISLTPSKNSLEVGERCNIVPTISNINGTNYKPIINISLEEAPNVTFEKTVEGIISISNNKIQWNPQISSSKRSDHGGFSVYCSTSGVKTIKMSFSLNGVTYSAKCSFTVNPPKTPENTSQDDESPAGDTDITNGIKLITNNLKVTQEEAFYLTITVKDILNYNDAQVFSFSLRDPVTNEEIDGLDELFDFYINETHLIDKGLDSNWIVDEYMFSDSPSYPKELNISPKLFDGNSLILKVIPNSVGRYVICINGPNDEGDPVAYSVNKISVIPKQSDLSVPMITLFKIEGDEELNRLGDEIQYFVKSMLQVTTENEYVPDWYKNFRIGVFNNMIEENTISRLDYTSTDDKIEIIINPPYDLNEGYSLSINPSETLYLIENSDDTSEEVEAEVLGKDIDNEIQVSELNLCCNQDSFDMTVKLEENDQIIWSQLYHIELNKDNFEEMKEVIIDENDYDNLTLEDIFNHAEYWSSELSSPNTFEEKTVDFMYNSKYPLYILFVGDYIEGDPLGNLFSFTQPILYEQDDSMSYNPQIYLPTPIGSILEDDELVTLELPSSSISNPFTVYNLDVGEDFETGNHLAIRGLIISMDVDYSDDLILTAKLKSPKGKPGTRSFVISGMNTENEDSIPNQIILGGSFELWGFNISDMVELGEWELEIQVDNPYFIDDGVSTLIFKNLSFAFYYITFQDDLIIAKINGEDSRHYGMFIQNVDVPDGLNSIVKFHEIEGSDFNKAYRMNIDKKEITLEFSVEGCTIFETTELIKEIAKLFVNRRDNMDEPIPNSIEFNNRPGEHWDYILEDVFDTDVDSVNYDTKVKLTIPDGTSWANNDTVTSITGYNNSITGVNPIIEVSPTSEFIELTETITNQRFSLKYDNYKEDDVIIIDCVNREATLKQYDSDGKIIYKDISGDVDYNADWFILPIGEFYFDTHGTCSRCIITYTQRG